MAEIYNYDDWKAGVYEDSEFTREDNEHAFKSWTDLELQCEYSDFLKRKLTETKETISEFLQILDLEDCFIKLTSDEFLKKQELLKKLINIKNEK